jgi:hypothetical protein
MGLATTLRGDARGVGGTAAEAIAAPVDLVLLDLAPGPRRRVCRQLRRDGDVAIIASRPGAPNATASVVLVPEPTTMSSSPSASRSFSPGSTP